MKKIRLFIADDHALFRKGIIGALLDEEGFEIKGEADSIETLLKSDYLSESDILLLDISLGNDSSLDSLPEITTAYPGLRILILSMHNKPIYIKRAVSSGASGYLLKSTPPQQLKQAIKEVFNGRKYLDPSLSESIFTLLQDNSIGSETDALYNTLSKREQQIFRLIAEGSSPAQIAKELYICRKTVENHRSNLMSKLGLNMHADIVQLAYKLGVI